MSLFKGFVRDSNHESNQKQAVLQGAFYARESSSLDCLSTVNDEAEKSQTSLQLLAVSPVRPDHGKLAKGYQIVTSLTPELIEKKMSRWEAIFETKYQKALSHESYLKASSATTSGEQIKSSVTNLLNAIKNDNLDDALIQLMLGVKPKWSSSDLNGIEAAVSARNSDMLALLAFYGAQMAEGLRLALIKDLRMYETLLMLMSREQLREKYSDDQLRWAVERTDRRPLMLLLAFGVDFQGSNIWKSFPWSQVEGFHPVDNPVVNWRSDKVKYFYPGEKALTTYMKRLKEMRDEENRSKDREKEQTIRKRKLVRRIT